MDNPSFNQHYDFRSIGITSWLVKQLDELNLRCPTPVQINCIPKILQGSDVLGCAKVKLKIPFNFTFYFSFRPEQEKH